jgi:hypothetical protein
MSAGFGDVAGTTSGLVEPTAARRDSALSSAERMVRKSLSGLVVCLGRGVDSSFSFSLERAAREVGEARHIYHVSCRDPHYDFPGFSSSPAQIIYFVMVPHVCPRQSIITAHSPAPRYRYLDERRLRRNNRQFRHARVIGAFCLLFIRA